MFRRVKPRKKVCYFTKNHISYIDYKDVELLKKYISPSGKITGVNEWGLRGLAYEIKKQMKGYYVVVNFTAEPKAVSEFNRIVALDSKVLRFLITVAHN